MLRARQMAIIRWAKSRQTPTRSVTVSSAEVVELLVFAAEGDVLVDPVADRLDATIALGQVAEFASSSRAPRRSDWQ
jgi:hypothetical protein